MFNSCLSDPCLYPAPNFSANHSAPDLRLVGFVLVQDDCVLDHAERVERLDYSEVDVRNVWSVYVDYGECQCCIACIEPCPTSFGDAAFAIGTGLPGSTCYVNGSAFVPCAIRARLADLAAQGAFNRLRPYLPHVACKPAFTTEGPHSPFKTSL